MKRFISLVFALSTMLSMFAYQSITITLKDGGEEGNDKIATSWGKNSDIVADWITTGNEYVESVDMYKIAPAKAGYGWKIGNTQDSGCVKITLKNEMRPVKILFQAAGYNSASQTSQYVCFNSTDYTELSVTPEFFDFDLDGNTPIKELEFKTIKTSSEGKVASKRCAYLQSITLLVLDYPTEPYIIPFPAEIDFGVVYQGRDLTKRFNLSAGNLTSDVSLSLKNASGKYTFPTSIAATDGKIRQYVEVKYTPQEVNGADGNMLQLSSASLTVELPMVAACGPQPAGYLYEKVTQNNLQDGDVVLIALSDKKYVNGDFDNSNNKPLQAVAILDYGKISESEICPLTLRQSGDKWLLLRNGKDTLGFRANSKILGWNTEGSWGTSKHYDGLRDHWTISIDEATQKATITNADTAAYFQFNTNNVFYPYATIQNPRELPELYRKVIVNRTLTVSADATKGHANGSGQYEMCDTVTISATANAGWIFTEWSDHFTDNPRTIVIDKNDTYTALFRIATFDIIVKSEDEQKGTVSGSQKDVEYNQTIQVSAKPKDHYHFRDWSDGDTQNPRTIVVTKAWDLTAHFDIDSITATFVDYKGEVVEKQQVPYGGNAMLPNSAPADEGYEFIGWEDGTENLTTDVTIRAKYDKIDVVLTLIANPVQGGTVIGAGTYKYGDKITATATANMGWHFVKWQETGETAATVSMTIVLNTTLSALFEEDVKDDPNTENALYDVKDNTDRAKKIIENGQIYILRNGKKYNVLGAEQK